ncbi:MAG TPA: hypothetical protein DCE23_06690 [Firmicutes bacterium]|nr:hypothetical protein [Bacillota bacterium]
MLKINENAIRNLKKKGKYVLVAGLVGFSLLLSGCGEREISTNSGAEYDIIDTTSDEALEKGIQQIKEIPGTNIKLVIDYKCDLNEGERWTVTSDKDLTMEIRTDGCPSDVHIYIDNVHTDTTICSYYPVIDGITQDTMDDRIHNSLMVGFPISDDNPYIGTNKIEGQNDTFIQGFIHGYNGYQSGSVEEKRFLESDYLNMGVNANKIGSVIDLIIVDGDKTSCVSVDSEVQVSVWPFIMRQDSKGSFTYRYYYFDEGTGKMTYKDLSEDEYLLQTEVYNQRKVKEK